MRNIPIDTSQMAFMASGGVQPKLKSRETGEVKTTEDGRTLCVVTTMATVAGGEGDLMRITAPFAELPTFQPGTPLVVSGLTVSEYDFNGRSGASFKAESIAPATGARAEAA